MRYRKIRYIIINYPNIKFTLSLEDSLNMNYFCFSKSCLIINEQAYDAIKACCLSFMTTGV